MLCVWRDNQALVWGLPLLHAAVAIEITQASALAAYGFLGLILVVELLLRLMLHSLAQSFDWRRVITFRFRKRKQITLFAPLSDYLIL